jgi:hypothetical protein
MADDPADYETLLKMYNAIECAPLKDPTVTYVINEEGVVNYYDESGNWRGCSSREVLNRILELSKPEDLQ